MTPTWPSTAAGTDPLVAWLRRAASSPVVSSWVLRGGIVTAVLCPGARAPADVDYVAPGDATTFDAAAIEAAVRAITDVAGAEVIWGETETPGVRLFLDGFQLDVAVGDPMCVPPRPLAIAGVGEVLACAPETLFGWKTHGLAEFGRGKWRAKDLFDLDLLWRYAPLDHATTRAAIELAFSSRALPLAALDDFRTRPTWGQSFGGGRKWRALRKAHPQITDDQTVTRDRVRAALDALLGAATPAPGSQG